MMHQLDTLSRRKVINLVSRECQHSNLPRRLFK